MCFPKVEINSRKLTEEITAVLRAISSTISENIDVCKDSLFNLRWKWHILRNHHWYY
jgi:hypothetical protein